MPEGDLARRDHADESRLPRRERHGGGVRPADGLRLTHEEIAAFIARFEARTLPKAEWTHEAHLLAALWYVSHHPYDEALAVIRARIRAFNDAVGTPNTDTEGYHETLTRLFLHGVARHRERHAGADLAEAYALLLASPMRDRAWPLQSYSRARLFSVEARRGWVPPDLAP